MLKLKCILKQIFLARVLQQPLHFIKKLCHKFLRVFLLREIRGVAIIVLESETEIERVCVAFVAEFEEAKELLQLCQYSVVDLALPVCLNILFLLIDGHQEAVSELGRHVKLLEHGNHVANVAVVVETQMSNR